MTPRGLHRVSSPVSPTPKRHPSPLPLHSSKNSSSSPHPLLGSPSPPLLSLRASSHPTDLAQQIAAVTQDLAGLHAEEQRLLQARAQSRTSPSQKKVRPRHNCVFIPRVSSVSPTLWYTRVLRQLILPQPHPDIHFSTFYSSRMNASGAAVISARAFLRRSRLMRCHGFCFYRRLRAELAASTAREAALRELLGPVPVLEPVPTVRDVFGDDESDAKSMDLATPLQPTVLLDPEDL